MANERGVRIRQSDKGLVIVGTGSYSNTSASFLNFLNSVDRPYLHNRNEQRDNNYRWNNIQTHDQNLSDSIYTAGFTVSRGKFGFGLEGTTWYTKSELLKKYPTMSISVNPQGQQNPVAVENHIIHLLANNKNMIEDGVDDITGEKMYCVVSRSHDKGSWHNDLIQTDVIIIPNPIKLK